jgi:hypothetical protein
MTASAASSWTLCLASMAWCLSCASVSEARIVMSIEAPGVAASQVSGVTVQDFGAIIEGPLGSRSTAIGVYESFGGVFVSASNEWGGLPALRGARYVSVDETGVLELTLPGPQGYFGLWWSAMEHWAANTVELTTLGRGTLSFDQIAIRNSGLLLPGHFGNPFAPYQGQNSVEPYAFVNLFATDEASRFTKIRLYGGRFESDNHTARPSLSAVRGTVVQVQGVPEPASAALLAAGLAETCAAARSQRRRSPGAFRQ